MSSCHVPPCISIQTATCHPNCFSLPLPKWNALSTRLPHPLPPQTLDGPSSPSAIASHSFLSPIESPRISPATPSSTSSCLIPRSSPPASMMIKPPLTHPSCATASAAEALNSAPHCWTPPRHQGGIFSSLERQDGCRALLSSFVHQNLPSASQCPPSPPPVCMEATAAARGRPAPPSNPCIDDSRPTTVFIFTGSGLQEAQLPRAAALPTERNSCRRDSEHERSQRCALFDMWPSGASPGVKTDCELGASLGASESSSHGPSFCSTQQRRTSTQFSMPNVLSCQDTSTTAKGVSSGTLPQPHLMTCGDVEDKRNLTSGSQTEASDAPATSGHAPCDEATKSKDDSGRVEVTACSPSVDRSTLRQEDAAVCSTKSLQESSFRQRVTVDEKQAIGTTGRSIAAAADCCWCHTKSTPIACRRRKHQSPMSKIGCQLEEVCLDMQCKFVSAKCRQHHDSSEHPPAPPDGPVAAAVQRVLPVQRLSSTVGTTLSSLVDITDSNDSEPRDTHDVPLAVAPVQSDSATFPTSQQRVEFNDTSLTSALPELPSCAQHSGVFPTSPPPLTMDLITTSNEKVPKICQQPPMYTGRQIAGQAPTTTGSVRASTTSHSGPPIASEDETAISCVPLGEDISERYYETSSSHTEHKIKPLAFRCCCTRFRRGMIESAARASVLPKVHPISCDFDDCSASRDPELDHLQQSSENQNLNLERIGRFLRPKARSVPPVKSSRFRGFVDRRSLERRTVIKPKSQTKRREACDCFVWNPLIRQGTWPKRSLSSPLSRRIRSPLFDESIHAHLSAALQDETQRVKRMLRYSAASPAMDFDEWQARSNNVSEVACGSPASDDASVDSGKPCLEDSLRISRPRTKEAGEGANGPTSNAEKVNKKLAPTRQSIWPHSYSGSHDHYHDALNPSFERKRLFHLSERIKAALRSIAEAAHHAV